MRGTIGRLANSGSRNCSRKAFISSSSSTFSTFSGGSGGGRGRGRGGEGPSSFNTNSQFAPQTPGKRIEEDTPVERQAPVPPPGVGHGRGRPVNSPNPVLPSFLSGINPSIGRGRTTQPPSNPSQTQFPQPQPQPPHPESESGQPKKPIFFSREDVEEPMQKPQFSNTQERMLPSSLLSGLPGAGRGRPLKVSGSDEGPAEENRHIRRRPAPGPDKPPTRRWEGETQQGAATSGQSQPRLSKEEAAKQAIGILSRDGGGGGGRGFVGRGGGGDRGGRGFRGGRGGRGGRGRGGRGGRGGDEDYDSDDDKYNLKLGDDADGERLAERLGPENMAKLTEAFDEMSYRVLPSPVDDAYLDALHTNNMIEYEPEYLVEFDNPDIDDKPPMSLRDALEKAKPFLMSYEGIKSQEEWEEAIEDLMERVPAMKELIDHYCGPDRVTAMQQQQELERVAKTLPENVPSSVKRFTDRAVLSLQSNPGWGWDKKCQFMDKLVWEVSQQYK